MEPGGSGGPPPLRESPTALDQGQKGPAREEEGRALYRLERRRLRREIKRAKALAWSELMASIEDDMCGLPYKLVMGRLSRSTGSFVASLSPETLMNLVGSFFPGGRVHSPTALWSRFRWDPGFAIGATEVYEAIKNARSKGGDPAPGPDGISLAAWRRVPGSTIVRLTGVYNACLEQGTSHGSAKGPGWSCYQRAMRRLTRVRSPRPGRYVC